MRPRALTALCLFLAASACTARPDLSGHARYALPADAPWPVLAPNVAIIAEPTGTEDPTEALQARAAATRARADRLARADF